jgi:hypothetical protein
MATLTQNFRAAAEATHAVTGKTKKPPRRTIDQGHTDTRNVTLRGDKKVGMALEDSTSGRPSRKSTRKSAHHGRSDTALMRTAREKMESPKARAGRSLAAVKKSRGGSR